MTLLKKKAKVFVEKDSRKREFGVLGEGSTLLHNKERDEQDQHPDEQAVLDVRTRAHGFPR